MMAKPTSDYRWATDNVAEYIQDKDGNTVLVLNKVNPALDTIASGVRARTPVSRGNYNYVLNSHGEHIDYLYIGEVGRVLIFEDSAGYTVTDMQNWYGGTWVDRGTQTLFGQTLRMFAKTA